MAHGVDRESLVKIHARSVFKDMVVWVRLLLGDVSNHRVMSDIFDHTETVKCFRIWIKLHCSCKTHHTSSESQWHWYFKNSTLASLVILTCMPFGPPEIWRFTLWIWTVSKVLMIHQQFLILRKKKMHCFITFPMQDQNKKQKLILCSMIFANQHEWLTL